MHPVLALYRRNAWATERLLEFCRERPEAVDTAAEPDIYGGVVPMFNHILGAEVRYLRLLTGELPADPVHESAPRPPERLLEPCRELASRWLRLLAAERDVESARDQPRGDDRYLMPDWVPLAQAVHHGDDHRTQIATALGRQGVEAPDVDGWEFGLQPDPGATAPAWADALLRRCLGHHLWATERLLEHSRGLPREQLALSAPGTYGSILDTLDHLVSADLSYLGRLRGGSRQPPLGAGAVEPLLEHWAGQTGSWPEYLDSHPDFEAMVETRDGRYPAWVFVLQALHHGNDHRTHAGTVLLHHGLEAPGLSVWTYAAAEGALRPSA